MKREGEQVCVIISKDILTEMDNMIKKDFFASRSSITRRALKEFIDKQKILA